MNVSMNVDSEHDFSITLDGAGEGDVRREGSGRPPAYRVHRGNYDFKIGADGPEGALPEGCIWHEDSRQLIWNTDMNVSMNVDSEHDFSITLDGAGEGDVRREGSGKGNAYRGGSGPGNAYRFGSGDGDARRGGEGDGNAIHKGMGDGEAIREGSGDGRTFRWKPPTTVETVAPRYQRQRQVRPAAPPPAYRVHRGNYDFKIGADGPEGALPEGCIWHEDSRQLIWNTDMNVSMNVDSEHDFSITLDGAGEGDVRREGSGKGNAYRGGSGPGNAYRFGSGDGDARRGGEGDGNAIHKGMGDGEAIREGSGDGRTFRWKPPTVRT